MKPVIKKNNLQVFQLRFDATQLFSDSDIVDQQRVFAVLGFHILLNMANLFFVVSLEKAPNSTGLGSMGSLHVHHIDMSYRATTGQ